MNRLKELLSSGIQQRVDPAFSAMGWTSSQVSPNPIIHCSWRASPCRGEVLVGADSAAAALDERSFPTPLSWQEPKATS